MAGEFGPSVYGAARAVQDFMRDKRAQESHETDQEIRRHALERTRRVEPLEDELRGLNIDVARLNRDQLQEAMTEAREARGKQKLLRNGLGKFHATGDPAHVSEALKQISPDTAGGSEARRNADGSISLMNGEGQEVKRLKGRKFPDGREMSPDDELSFLAFNAFDPIKAVESKWGQQQKAEIEGMQQQGALERTRVAGRLGVERENIQQSGALTRQREGDAAALTRTREEVAGRAAVADTAAAARIAGGGGGGGGADAAAKQLEREHSRIPRVLDDMMKPENSPSGFSASYSYEHDKALRPLIEEAVEDALDQSYTDGKPKRVRAAARAAIDETRQKYLKVQKAANTYAAALAKKKIKPNDIAAVEAAAKAGNTDAQKLMGVHKIASDALSPSVAKYLFDNLSVKD